MKAAPIKIDPGRFWAMQDEIDARMRAAAPGVLLLAMRDGPDPAMTGNWSWEDGRLASAGLLHGDPESGGPYCHVITTATGPDDVVRMQRLAAIAAAAPRATRTMPDELGTGTLATTVEIDGPMVETQSVNESDRWFQTAILDGTGIVVESRGVDPRSIVLVRVTEVEPYLDGRRQYLRSRRGRSVERPVIGVR
ncbi:hypothetical protein ABT297_37025 [Dactylosporangium sp. NPDC000555]|uniref:hypothetical protein n=1 Tax=Dactylosporangium sp. NPDC000555 TaxID=3154260 RepID=UPI0033219F65